MTRNDGAAEGTPPGLQQLLRKASSTARRLSGRKPIEGFVDRVLAGEILGWAFDPNKANRRVHIVARHNGEIIAEALADLPRKDLARGGKGDGRHGFNLRIPGQYLDGAPRQLRVEAAVGRSLVLLQGGAITIAAALPALTPPRKPPPPRALQGPGRLESVVNGVLNGWAAHPNAEAAGAVVDVYDDERYLGSATADRTRPKLQEAGAPANAMGFQFRLPVAPDPALLKRLRARIAGAQLDLLPLKSPDGKAARADPAETAPVAASARSRPRRTVRAAPAEGRVSLLVYGPGEPDAVRRTARSWTDQTWSDVAIGRLSDVPEVSSPAGEHVFTGADAGRLLSFVAEARTVVLAPAGEILDPAAARLLAQVRPLSDVLTWEVSDRAGGGLTRRRSEAWPLALQLGAALNGGFAVRSRALGPILAGQVDGLASGGVRALELALAGDPALRWSHLPSTLSGRLTPQTVTRHAAVTPPHRARRLSIAVWPRWSDAAVSTLASLLDGASGAELEVLAPAEAVSADLERRLAALAPGAAMVIRAVDAPELDRPGAWQRVLSQAATGDVVLLCRAGVTLADAGPALRDLAAWALSPLVGAVTGEIAAGEQTFSGLAVASGRNGWRIASAHDPSQAGTNRPILAASAALLAVERRKLAAVGGIYGDKLPDGGTGFDLGLRLRQHGWASVLLGGVRAAADPKLLRRDTAGALALYDTAELASAAAAYPAVTESRPRPPSEG